MSFEFNPFSGNFDKVRDISGTTNQVNVAQTGDNFTLSTPQDIHTGATPQFQDVQAIGTGLGSRLLGKTLALLSSTGVIDGLDLSINGGNPALLDIAPGFYEVVDVNDPDNPVVTPVTFAGVTGVTLTNLATADNTYIFLTSAGTVFQQTTPPTPEDRRSRAFVGRVNHASRTTIQFAQTTPDYKLSHISQIYDLLDAMAPFKMSGLEVAANGVNLSFNLGAGAAFFRSANYSSNKNNPHTVSFGGASPTPFRKMTQTTFTDLADVTVIEPNYYDVGGVRTLSPGNNNSATVQRIYAYRGGNLRVAYGQVVHQNLATAINSINSEAYVPNPSISQAAILVGYIVVTKAATDLSDPTQARIITAARFDAGGAAVSGGTTSLQQAYLNSTLPQIILNSTQGTLTVDDNATPLGTDLFSVRNNGGTSKYFSVGSNYVQLPTSTTAQIAAVASVNGKLGFDTDKRKMYADYGSSVKNPIVTKGVYTDSALLNNFGIFISNNDMDQTWLVAGSGGPITLNANTPFNNTVAVDGMRVTLIGSSDTNTVTVPANDATYAILGYDVVLYRGHSATYEYNATLDRWIIISTSN